MLGNFIVFWRLLCLIWYSALYPVFASAWVIFLGYFFLRLLNSCVLSFIKEEAVSLKVCKIMAVIVFTIARCLFFRYLFLKATTRLATPSSIPCLLILGIFLDYKMLEIRSIVLLPILIKLAMGLSKYRCIDLRATIAIMSQKSRSRVLAIWMCLLRYFTPAYICITSFLYRFGLVIFK